MDTPCKKSSYNPSQQENVRDLVPPYITLHSYLNIAKPFNPHHRNMSFLFELSARPNLSLLQKTVDYLLDYHDVLRSRFEQQNEVWTHFILTPDKVEVPVHCVDLSSIVDRRQRVAIEAVAQDFQASLNLSHGPLFQIVYMDLGREKSGRLLMIFHHVLLDGFSSAILLADFMTIYEQLYKGEPVDLPPKSVSFKQWAIRINEYGHSPQRCEDMDYWLSLPWNKVTPFPLDYPYVRDMDTIALSDAVKHAVSMKETSRLLQSCTLAKISLMDVLLTALTLALAQWIASPFIYVGTINHTRFLFEDLDISHTVGFFSLCQDMLLSVDVSEPFMDTLHSIKKQFAAIPSKGFSKDILSYLSVDSYIIEKMKKIPFRPVLLNYTGHSRSNRSQPSFYKVAQESAGAGQDGRNLRLELLYIECFIVKNQLYISIEYGTKVHERTTIENLMSYFVEALKRFSTS